MLFGEPVGTLKVCGSSSPLWLSWTVYDLLSGHIVKKLTNHKACVRDVSWHPFEEKIVSSSVRFGGPAHVWDLELGRGSIP